MPYLNECSKQPIKKYLGLDLQNCLDEINQLSKYIAQRKNLPQYLTKIRFFNRDFNFGYSRDEKIAAAQQKIDVLLGKARWGTLESHQGAFEQGSELFTSMHTRSF